MRPLHRPRPDVHVALLVEAAVEREGVRVLPGPHHQVMRLEIALAQQARVLAVAVAGVHRRADREAGDQPPAGDDVDHRELFRDARRRIVQRERIAHHADRGVARAPRQRRGDQVGRRHQPVAVGMVLVAAHGVEAAIRRELHLVHEVVVHQMRALRIEQRRVDVDPHRRVLLPEILRQLGVRHQMEPEELHERVHSSLVRTARDTGEYGGETPWSVNSRGEALAQAQCPSSHIQPPPGCCTHWPGTHVVWPGGGGTYCPGCQAQLLPLSSQWPGCQTTGPAPTGGGRDQLALRRRRRARRDDRRCLRRLRRRLDDDLGRALRRLAAPAAEQGHERRQREARGMQAHRRQPAQRPSTQM